jgi:hypothetical protein
VEPPAVYGEQVVALAELDLEVGMRLGELLNARWADVDEFDKLIFVMKTKNDKPRLIPLTTRALAILKCLRQDAPDNELIFDSTRTGRKRRQLMVCFERAVRETGIGDFHFHDLRHTFATRLRAANMHEYDIADLLGHSTTPGETHNTKVTRGYAHGVPQRLRDGGGQSGRGQAPDFGYANSTPSGAGREGRRKGQPSKWLTLKDKWRRGWDSNPRWPFDHSGFRDRCTKPLCDLSALERMKDEGKQTA